MADSIYNLRDHNLIVGADQPVRALPVAMVQGGSLQMFDHYVAETEMWTGQGDRRVEQALSFARPFDRVPQVMLSVTLMDAAHEQNMRYELAATEVSETGCRVVFATWSDTRIARLAVSWIALG